MRRLYVVPGPHSNWNCSWETEEPRLQGDEQLIVIPLRPRPWVEHTVSYSEATAMLESGAFEAFPSYDRTLLATVVDVLMRFTHDVATKHRTKPLPGETIH